MASTTTPARPRRAAIALSLIQVLAFVSLVVANPYPRDDIYDAGYGYLMNRACDSYCGRNNAYCCNAEQTCFTSAGMAVCSSSGSHTFATPVAATNTYTTTSTSTYQTPSGTESFTEVTETITSASTWNPSSTPTQTSTSTSTTAAPMSTSSQLVSPTSPSTESPASFNDDTGLSGGAIAGIVVGAVAAIALIGLLIFFVVLPHRRRRQAAAGQVQEVDGSTPSTGQDGNDKSELETFETPAELNAGLDKHGNPETAHELGTGHVIAELDGSGGSGGQPEESEKSRQAQKEKRDELYDAWAAYEKAKNDISSQQQPTAPVEVAGDIHSSEMEDTSPSTATSQNKLEQQLKQQKEEEQKRQSVAAEAERMRKLQALAEEQRRIEEEIAKLGGGHHVGGGGSNNNSDR